MQCGRRFDFFHIAGLATHIGHLAYHPECTHGPSYPTHYELPQPLPVQHYTVPMDDERVRQIVRDELQRAGLFNSPHA